MTVSFNLLMTALEVQLYKMHYVHKYRGFLVLGDDARIDLLTILAKEFQDQDFISTDDFMKKTTKFIAKIKRNADNQERRDELGSMKRILSESFWSIEDQDDAIKAGICREELLALVDDENEEKSLGM